MKKILAFAFMIYMILLSSDILSQFDYQYREYDLAWEEEKNYVSFGYGVGNFSSAILMAAFSGSTSNIKHKPVGPFFGKYEYAFSDLVGFGLNIAYIDNTMSAITPNYTLQDNSVITLVETINFNSFSALARINFHFGANARIDPYLGIGMGYRYAAYSFSDNDPFSFDEGVITTSNIFPMGFETTLGSRFYFTENFGAYVEFGFSKAIFQFGVTSKF